MRAVSRSVLAAVGIAASFVADPSGVSAAATSQSDRFAIASIQPSADHVVGVAHPVVVKFRAPVVDRHAAEQAMHMTATPR